MAVQFRDYAASNVRHTWVLFGVFIIIILTLGWVFSQIYGDPNFLAYAVIFSLAYSFISYFASARIALSMARARQVKREDNPMLYDMVKNLSQRVGIPMPSLYTTLEMQINAFATGRNPNNAAVAVTAGALQKLNQSELEGVLAHELSHVKNRDILVSTVAAVLAGIISLVADIFLRSFLWNNNREEGGGVLFIFGLALSVLAPIGTMLIQLAISRKRESLADASGVESIHNREGLISALEKIRIDSTPMRTAKTSTAHMWIENPFKGKNTWWQTAFSSHPPIEQRIAALRRLAV
jgi:heat shock protein HtpX